MISPQLILETTIVILRPVSREDMDAFAALAQDISIWKYFTFELNDPLQLEKWMEVAFDERKRGTRVPFTVVDKRTGQVAGSTSYGNISYFDKRLEIGWSWLGTSYQGTGLNFHAKYALLYYAFEVLQFERVEIKTDNLNERAKQGLRKIGAKEEGVLRSHMQMPHGRRRDSVYFSILKSEWPGLKSTIFKDMPKVKYEEGFTAVT